MTAADVSNESDRDLDLQRLVGTFAGLVRQYPDLDFLDPGGMLVIKDPVPAVSQVRIELPGSTALRLRSVLLEADGLDDPAAQVTATASSAASKEAAARLRKGGLLLADQTGVGVQTRREDRPWLELALDRPRDLRRITVINVADQTALDARGIRVLVRTADGWWTTLYDGAARERTFAQHVERHFGGRLLTRRLEDAVRRRLNRPAPTRPQPVAADLVRIMTAIQLRDHGPVFKDIDRVRWTRSGCRSSGGWSASSWWPDGSRSGRSTGSSGRSGSGPSRRRRTISASPSTSSTASTSSTPASASASARCSPSSVIMNCCRTTMILTC